MNGMEKYEENEEEFNYIPWEIPTPSELEGLSLVDEKKIRIFMSGLIQEAGILLKLPQVCILTGMSIFQRFYFKKSFLKFDPLHCSCASLFIATKIEESFRKVRDLVSIFHHLSKKKSGCHPIPVLDVTSEQYVELKQKVLVMERYVLKELGFNLGFLGEHPHKHLKLIVGLIKGSSILAQTVCFFDIGMELFK
jgi:cyclin L